MKKIFFIIPVLALTLVLSGCAAKKAENQNQNSNSEEDIAVEEQNNQPEMSDEEAQKNKDEFLNWIGKKDGVNCTITTSETVIEVQSKNGKIKIEEKDKENNVLATTLNDGEWMYLWSEDDGVKYKGEEAEDSWKLEDDLEYLAEEASINKFECQDASFDDAVFSVPANVNFSEESEEL